MLCDLKKKVAKLNKKPGLAVIFVGNDPASLLYIKNKKRAAEKIGVKFELHKFSTNVANKMLITRIKNLNERKDIHGIIVQLPLPKHLDTNKIISAIDPKKDVDGFCPNSRHVSPVAQAVVALLEAAKKKLKNNKAILFVKSEIFVKPIEKLMERRGAKVQVILNPTLQDLKKRAKAGDIVVIALGRPHILKREMIKNGAVVIDVGITKKRKEFLGDFDPTGSEKKKGFYTPVPGGVGPMTVAMVLKNVVISACGT